MILQRSLGSARIFSMNGSNTLGSTSGSSSNVFLGRDDRPALFASKRSQKPGSAMQAAKRCSPLAAGERGSEGDVHLVDRRVVAVGADERRPGTAGVVDPAEVPGQGGSLVGDLYRFDRGFHEGGRLLEDG